MIPQGCPYLSLKPVDPSPYITEVTEVSTGGESDGTLRVLVKGATVELEPERRGRAARIQSYPEATTG